MIQLGRSERQRNRNPWLLGLWRLTPLLIVLVGAWDLSAAASTKGGSSTLVPGRPPQVVFESVRIIDRGGRERSKREIGSLTVEDWQRAARPWTHAGEAYVYQEEAWERRLPDGTSERGYRVVKTPRAAVAPRTSRPSPPELGLDVTAMAARGGTLDVILSLRDYPDWDVPLLPASPYLSQAERDSGLTRRRAALQDRRAMFDRRAADLLAHVRAVGGDVVGRGWGGGWILARIPSAALAELAARTDLQRIDGVSGGAKNEQADPGSADETTLPGPGQFNLGEARHNRRLDVNRLLAAGHNGEIGNPARHPYGDIVVGVNELGVLEDEGCYLGDGNGCSSPSRLREKYTCNGDTPGARCSPESDFPDVDEPGTAAVAGTCCNVDSDCGNSSWKCSLAVATTLCSSARACECVADTCARHATSVTSIAVGDYGGGQGDGLWMGDSECPEGCIHGHTFKNLATGMAPEASLFFWGRHKRPGGLSSSEQDDSLAGAFMGAIERHVDVLNNSWAWNEGPDLNGNGVIEINELRVVYGTDCNPIAIRAIETEAENAYDDGILVVLASGNNPDGVSGTSAPCDISSPADIPKVFAVNGLPSAGTCVRGGVTLTCAEDYTCCLVGPAAGATGGATVKTPDGVSHAGALTAVAATAPTGLRYFTTERGEHGEVDPVRGFGGSSGAAAVVTGLAAVVKSSFLARGAAWINSPGALFTVMLALADRHFDASPAQRATGFDREYGAGRLKLRRLDADWNAYITQTAIDSGPVGWLPFTAPLPAGTRIAKCVLFQEEDMSGKEIVSDVNLRVEIRAPVDGLCDPDGGLVMSPPREDASFDVKSMVAITDTDATLSGNCLHVVATAGQIAPPSVTWHTFCHASSIRDDGELPDADADELPDADEEGEGTSSSLADSDGDGINDGTEVYERRSSPLLADTDADGDPDATDRATFDSCTTRSLDAPQIIAPAPGDSTMEHPTFQWVNAPNADGARVELCPASGCPAGGGQVFLVTGTELTLPVALPQGSTWTWRAFAITEGDLGCRPSGLSTFTVADTIPPTLNVPADMTSVATSASGATVSYAATAMDLVDGAIDPVCTPASGSLLPPGTTTVTCDATDHSGNQGSASFQVSVSFSWSGVLQPINADGSSIFKLGSVLPVKFALTGASAAIGDGLFRLFLSKVSNSVSGSEIEAETAPSSDAGNSFRYDPAGGQYIFNLGTKALSQGTWKLSFDLGDGVDHSILVSLRK